MHVFSGFSGLIVYGENIYKEYKGKKLLILLLFETENKAEEKKYPKKCQ